VALTDRIPYLAQVDRPKLKLPDGKKLAVWVILNVEEWRIENAMPRTVLSPPMGQPLLPDVPNWSRRLTAPSRPSPIRSKPTTSSFTHCSICHPSNF